MRQHAPDAYAKLEIDGTTVHTFLEVDRERVDPPAHPSESQ